MIFTPTESVILAALFLIVGLCIYVFLARRVESKFLLEITEQRPSRENVIDRCAEILARAAWHREQLEAENEEFRLLHGYEKYSYEADELEGVIFDGTNYENVMDRILERFKG